MWMATCINPVVVKKYAVLAILPERLGFVSAGKNVCAICTIATTGPAARKLHKNTAKQTNIVIPYFVGRDQFYKISCNL
jgi:hypothetical protein